MNAKQVRSVLCGLSPTEQDILKNEYDISVGVSDIDTGVTNEMGKQAISWLYGIPSEYTLTNRPEPFADFLTELHNEALHKHVKPEKQRNKEVRKRRKKNKNKKTHRKK